MSVRSTLGLASRAGNSDSLEHLARVGLLAYGLVHVVVAGLALRLAWAGDRDRPADQSGAMATLAEQPLGTALLAVLGLGLAALAVWQAAEALRWRFGGGRTGSARRKALWKSARSVAKAAVYAAIAVLAVRYAFGDRGSSSSSQRETTAGVLGWPGGRYLVIAAGLVLLGIGVQHVWKGLSSRFLKQLDLSGAPPLACSLITRTGQIGFPGKGIALGLVGGLLGWAAITFDPEKATGLDGALRTVLLAPAGAVLLTLVALGIAAFGAFCIARARYPERN